MGSSGNKPSLTARFSGRRICSWMSLVAVFCLFTVPLLHHYHQLPGESAASGFEASVEADFSHSVSIVVPDASSHDEQDCLVCQVVSQVRVLTAPASVAIPLPVEKHADGTSTASLLFGPGVAYSANSPRAPPSFS